MKICAKGAKSPTPFELLPIGGPRYMCGRELNHEGSCGDWIYVSQQQHAHAMATHENLNDEIAERLMASISTQLKRKEMTVKAKFVCQTITRQKQYDGQEGQTIRLMPVSSGSDENKEFYKYTPGGSVELTTVNPEAGAYFELGESYYLEFTKAPK